MVRGFFVTVFLMFAVVVPVQAQEVLFRADTNTVTTTVTPAAAPVTQTAPQYLGIRVNLQQERLESGFIDLDQGYLHRTFWALVEKAAAHHGINVVDLQHLEENSSAIQLFQDGRFDRSDAPQKGFFQAFHKALDLEVLVGDYRDSHESGGTLFGVSAGKSEEVEISKVSISSSSSDVRRNVVLDDNTADGPLAAAEHRLVLKSDWHLDLANARLPFNNGELPAFAREVLDSANFQQSHEQVSQEAWGATLAMAQAIAKINWEALKKAFGEEIPPSFTSRTLPSASLEFTPGTPAGGGKGFSFSDSSGRVRVGSVLLSSIRGTDGILYRVPATVTEVEGKTVRAHLESDEVYLGAGDDPWVEPIFILQR